MKQILVLLGCAVLLLLIGCQNGNRNKSPVEVIIERGGQFPEFLAGTWKCTEEELEIVFEPSGTISAAALPMCRTRIKPGETTEINPDPNYKAVFQPGPWTVYYAPAERELTVELSLERFRVEKTDGVIEGKSRDIFTGKVSEDGSTWQADWFCFPEYYVTTDVYKNYKLPIDPNDNYMSALIFEKVVKPPEIATDSNTVAH